MISITIQEKEKIYSLICHNKNLTARTLKQNGFTEGKIKALESQNVIKKNRNGTYKLVSIGALYIYGSNQLLLGNVDEALTCYERYYEVEPSSPSANFAMFIHCIIKRDYSNIIKYLDGFIRPEKDKIQNNDYNFYLYLLGNIIDLPPLYKMRVKNMKYSDIEMHPNRPDRSTAPIRIMVYYSQDFLHSNKLLNQLGYKTLDDIVLHYLLTQALERQNNYIKRIGVLTRERNYVGLTSLLEQEANRHKLKITWRAYYLIAKDILNMLTTGVPSVPIREETTDFFRLIQLKDYERAKENNNRFIYLQKKSYKYNELGILLEEALKLQKKLSLSSNGIHQTEQIPEPVYIPSTEMINSFINGRPIEGLEFLRCIIDLKGLQEYNYLLVNTTRICIEEGDTAYIKPLTILSELSRGVYKVKVSDYINDFEYFIRNNRFASARLCIDIISNASRRNHLDISKEEVYALHNSLDKKLSHAKSKYMRMCKAKPNITHQ